MPQLEPDDPQDVDTDALIEKLKGTPMKRETRSELIAALHRLNNLQFDIKVCRNDFVRLNRMDTYARFTLRSWVYEAGNIVLAYTKPKGQSGKIRAAIDKLWASRPHKDQP